MCSKGKGHEVCQVIRNLRTGDRAEVLALRDVSHGTCERPVEKTRALYSDGTARASMPHSPVQAERGHDNKDFCTFKPTLMSPAYAATTGAAPSSCDPSAHGRRSLVYLPLLYDSN